MTQTREHWGSRIGFIMATAGSAIGLGSLWRFPYTTGENGGGAFVLLYLIFTFLIGIPIFISELVIGRTAQKSAVKAYTDLAPKSNHWRLLGWVNLLTSLLILSYYSVVAGWTLNYTFMSINHFTRGKTPAEIESLFDIMYMASDINVFWHFIFMLMTIGVVYAGIRKGIEYWSKILTPALIIILLGLFSYSASLPGFKKALYFVLYPDFSKLGADGVLAALGMACFTLSVGLGIILTYGSYMKPSSDIPKTSFIIATVSVLVSLFAALMIFPIIFTFGFTAEAGPGLVFKTLPVLFAKLPATLVISTIFFILFVFTSLTSSISLLEIIAANLIEVFHWSRKQSVLLAGGAAFLIGIPTALSGSGALFPSWKTLYGTDFFEFINYLTGSWMMPISGLLTILFIGWFMDKKLIHTHFLQGTTLKGFYPLWFYTVRYIAPIAMFAIILQEGGIFNFGIFSS